MSADQREIRERLDYLIAQDKKSKERTEKVVFVGLVLGGIAFIGGAWWFSDVLIQSLLMNVGSNVVVFVLLFGVFQLFVGKQPGNAEQDQLKHRRGGLDSNIIDQPSMGYPAGGSPRPLNPGYTDSDQASI